MKVTMNFRKSLRPLALFGLAFLLLAGCSRTPMAGVLRGKLVAQDGSQLSGEYTVGLCTMDSSAEQCTLTSKYHTTTVGGEFELRDVPAGDYAVYVLSQSGNGILLQRDAGQTLVIRLEAGKDFDLGTITLRPGANQ
jgi:hypothetical protein